MHIVSTVVGTLAEGRTAYDVLVPAVDPVEVAERRHAGPQVRRGVSDGCPAVHGATLRTCGSKDDVGLGERTRFVEHGDQLPRRGEGCNRFGAAGLL